MYFFITEHLWHMNLFNWWEQRYTTVLDLKITFSLLFFFKNGCLPFPTLSSISKWFKRTFRRLQNEGREIVRVRSNVHRLVSCFFEGRGLWFKNSQWKMITWDTGPVSLLDPVRWLPVAKATSCIREAASSPPLLLVNTASNIVSCFQDLVSFLYFVLTFYQSILD